jgi:hypothetical protein
MGLLRLWLTNPGPFFVVLGLNLLLAVTTGVAGPVAVTVLGFAAWATLVQGLRVGWAEHRTRTAVYTTLLLVPFLAIAVVDAAAGRGSGWFVLALLSPVAAAVLANRVFGPFVPPQASKRPSWKAGCLTAFLMAASFVGWFFLALRQPGNWARRAREAFRVGEPLTPEPAAPGGRFLASATPGARDAGPPPEPVRYGCGGDESCWIVRGAGRATDLTRLALVAALGAELRARPPARLSFTFRGSMLPLKVSFDVELDARGRILSVSPPRAWD